MNVLWEICANRQVVLGRLPDAGDLQELIIED